MLLLHCVGHIHLEVAGKHMRAVEVRGCPGVAQAFRVVAGEEQADVALFIEGMAPGVAAAKLEVVRKPLLQVRFEGVVGRNAHGLEVRSVRADTRHTAF